MSTLTIPHLKAVIERFDRSFRTMICTAPVIDAATDVLAAWCAAAIDHGCEIDTDRSAEHVRSLAAVALDLAIDGVEPINVTTPDEATRLLDAVATRCRERGVETARDVLYVPIPRTSTTPAWGAQEPRPLAITISPESGWAIVVDQPCGSRAVCIVGTCTTAGIDAMLDLVLEVNAGRLGNVFS